MIIKQKNDLSQKSILFTAYLKSISVESAQSERHEYARKKLDVAMQASQAVKENTPIDVQQEKQADVVEAALIPSLEKELSVPQGSTSAVDSKVNSPIEGLKKFLAEVADNRKRNELVYGYKAGVLPQINKRWGLETSETADCYKRNFDSTITRGDGEWAEFGIGYDNKVFLSATSADSKKNDFDFNHETMGCGTFLKAAGELNLENGELIISPYSQSLELGPDYLPIILFVLQEKGYPISPTNTFIVDEKGNRLPYVKVATPDYSSQLEPVSYYLNGSNFFPSAKAIAENKKLSIEARLSELFLSIDDEILSAKRQGVIKILNATRAVLKAEIVGFLSLLVGTNLHEVAKGFPKQEQDIAENNLPNTGEGSSKLKQNAQDGVIETKLHAEEGGKESKKQEQGEDSLDVISQETSYQRYRKIITHIETFQSHSIDISFVTAELLSWFYYLSALGFQADSKMEMMPPKKEDPALAVLQEIEADLTKIKETPSILPQRFLVESDGTVSPFIRFYTENPIKTCIALLRDYTKGGFFGRLFSGAWRRKYIKQVEQFLERYESQQFADNLSIQAIYQELFGVEGTLEEHTGKKGTLFARLLFCAKLANEVQNESRDQTLVATPSSKTSEELEVEEERQETVISETSPLITTTIDPSSPSALKRTSVLEVSRSLDRKDRKVSFFPRPSSPDKDKVLGNSEGAVSNDRQVSSTRSPTLSRSSSSE